MNRVQNGSSKHWHAIYVRSRHEKKTNELLKKKCIETSLPLITVTRQWSDRWKQVEIPLFTGYIFVIIDEKQGRIPILSTPGVVKFVSFNGLPSVVPERQMYWLSQMLAEGGNLRRETTFPNGSAVEVVFGPLLGLQGVVKKARSGTRLVVWFDAIMQGISVELDSACLDPVGQ